MSLWRVVWRKPSYIVDHDEIVEADSAAQARQKWISASMYRQEFYVKSVTRYETELPIEDAIARLNAVRALVGPLCGRYIGYASAVRKEHWRMLTQAFEALGVTKEEVDAAQDWYWSEQR